MKKKILALVMATVMVLSLAACGGKEEAPAAKEETKTEAPAAKEEAKTEDPKSVTTLKFNTVQTSSDPKVAWYTEWLDEIAAASNGTVDYEMYVAEALGGSADVLEMATMGQPVVQDCDFSYIASYVPDFAVAMSPYLFTSPEQIKTFWKSDIGQELCAELEAQGLRLLNVHYFGTRNVLCNAEVKSRADFGKLKLRCAATPMWNEVVRVLGGNAVNTAWSETYQALSQGVADGAESPMNLLYSSKLYEPCKYLIRTEHLVAATCVVMSQEVYENLPAEGKAALDEVGTSFSDTVIPLQKAAEAEYEQMLIDEGVKIVEIAKDEFIEAAATTPDYFPEWTEGLYERCREALNG